MSFVIKGAKNNTNILVNSENSLIQKQNTKEINKNEINENKTNNNNNKYNYNNNLIIPESTEPKIPDFLNNGLGTVNSWYDLVKSEYLLDNPIKTQYDQMIKNIVKDNEEWAFISIPTIDELPYVGEWWDWEKEIENIKNVINYAGKTLGKFETHFVAATEVVDKLQWESVDFPLQFEIFNENLINALREKKENNLPLTFSENEWNNFNIDKVYTFTCINVDGTYYKPVSPANNRINAKVMDKIKKDKNRGYDIELKAEYCSGVCYSYSTKDRQRFYMIFYMGFFYDFILAEKAYIFEEGTDQEKINQVRNFIYTALLHEYCHIIQSQLLDPEQDFRDKGFRWGAENNGLGDEEPNSLSRWWFEGLAEILPLIMLKNENKFIELIDIGLKEIRDDPDISADEFARRLVYIDGPNGYGYLTRPNWNLLACAYMAKLKSWNYIFFNFYYDFQRIVADELVPRQENEYAPNLDKLFLHNFGKTEVKFLEDLFTLIRNDKTIDLDYFIPGGYNNNIKIDNLEIYDTNKKY